MNWYIVKRKAVCFCPPQPNVTSYTILVPTTPITPCTHHSMWRRTDFIWWWWWWCLTAGNGAIFLVFALSIFLFLFFFSCTTVTILRWVFENECAEFMMCVKHASIATGFTRITYCLLLWIDMLSKKEKYVTH